MQQSQHILSCVAVVIPDNAFKYLLQCYLADDNEIAGKCSWKKMEMSCASSQGSYQAQKQGNDTQSTQRKAIALRRCKLGTGEKGQKFHWSVTEGNVHHHVSALHPGNAEGVLEIYLSPLSTAEQNNSK